MLNVRFHEAWYVIIVELLKDCLDDELFLSMDGNLLGCL